jgi:ubiquinone/menaquinone biosynthesis C-methylase UbiE
MSAKLHHEKDQFNYYQSFAKTINHRNALRYFDKRCQIMADHVVFEKHIHILDIGCGDGLFLSAILKHFADSFPVVAGVDISPQRVDKAKELLPIGTFCTGQADNLPFPDGTFDLVMCNALLHHVPDVFTALTEMIRVCRTGGQLFLIEPNKRHPLICIMSAMKRIEWGIFGLSYSKIQACFRAEGCVVKTIPLNCLLYPYQSFPPASLCSVFEWLEDFLEISLLSTHIVFVVDKKRHNVNRG